MIHSSVPNLGCEQGAGGEECIYAPTFSPTAYAVALRWELGRRGKMLISTIRRPSAP